VPHRFGETIATLFNSKSPTLWPNVSLMTLKAIQVQKERRQRGAVAASMQESRLDDP